MGQDLEIRLICVLRYILLAVICTRLAWEDQGPTPPCLYLGQVILQASLVVLIIGLMVRVQTSDPFLITSLTTTMIPSRNGEEEKKRKVDEFAAMNGYMEGYPPGMEGHGVGQAKTKRARTSFKHHQLRIMKAHFQHNQNPDSRELKMLSQKTGLDKKVLQVWFQNARAKWRRMNANGGATIEGVMGPDDDMKGDDLSSDMSPGDCGPNSMISCC